jgi:hypothetical protein
MKTFKQFRLELNEARNKLNEQTLYRGQGDNSSDKFIVWYSTSEEQAQGYAKSRTNSKIITLQFNGQHIVDFDHDTLKLNPNQFAQRALSQVNNKASLDMNKLKLAKDEFTKHFGSNSIEVMDYWKDDKTKEETSKFLKLMGFEAITILEDGIKTFGILK